MKISQIILLSLGFVRSVAAWDYTGHMLVDQIAFNTLRPEVRAKVSAVVANLDSRYNGHHAYNFITAGCWMDDYRSSPSYSLSALHYIDVPYAPAGLPYVEPSPPHALSAIEHALETLRNAQSTAEEKAENLGILMHLIGDIHQPLHCVDWNDRGGNAYPISGIPFSDLGKKQTPNLHSFWDKSYRFDSEGEKVVEKFYGVWPSERPGEDSAGPVKEQVAQIMAQFAPAVLYQLAEKNPHAWARESYLLACLYAYPVGPHPQNDEIVELSPAYVHGAYEISRSRIALAGYRLAALLDDLYGK
ncbi:MAG: S1/P1 nuclease [Verrucomicrobiota bacterium]|nr:S1/P1 nuclease [Verrucomicrobiota bacterium]